MPFDKNVSDRIVKVYSKIKVFQILAHFSKFSEIGSIPCESLPKPILIYILPTN